MKFRRGAFRALIGGAVLACIAGLTAFASSAAATLLTESHPALTAVKVGPLAQLGACLQQRKAGDVLFVIDRSSSLRTTDPDAARVVGAQLVLDQLLSESTDAKIKFTVAIAGFDASLGTASDWTDLNGESEGALTAKIATFAGQNQGIETDYWTALTQAETKLTQHAAADGTPKACQAMLLFTDGRYQLQTRDTPALRSQYGVTKPIPGVQNIKLLDDGAVNRVIQAGENDICRTGGVADGLRADGVTLIAVGLQSDASAGTRDFSFLQRITENPRQDCGQQPANGYLVQADNVDDLLFAFNDIANPQNSPQPPVKKGVCPFKACPQQAHNFTLDTSIKKINLLGAVNADGVDVYLQLPGHAFLQLPYASGVKQMNVGHTTLQVRWRKTRTISIDAVFGGATDWSGPWSLTFVDRTGQHPDAVSETQLTISGDLQGVLAAPTTPARAGESATMMLSLTRRDGTPTDLGQPAPSVHVSISAAAFGSTDDPQTVLDQVPVTASVTPVHWAIPATFASSQARLTVVLSVRTVGGQALQDEVTSVAFAVAPPLGYPRLSASNVAFPKASGRKAVHANLAVSGPGCVWVDGSTMEVFPAGSAATAVTSQNNDSAHCLRLSDRQNGSLRLTLKPGAQGNGNLQGRITVHLAPDGHLDRAHATTVTFTGSQQRLPNAPVRWTIFVAAMIIGIGFPLLILFWLRWRAARFPAFTPTSTLADIVLSEDSIAMADGSPIPAPGLWRDDPQITGSRRETTVSGLTVRARAGMRLQGAGYAVVTGGGAGVGSQPPHHVKAERLPVLPLQLRGGWAVFFDPAAGGATVRAKLLLIAGPQPNPQAMAQEMSDLFAAAARDAPRLARAIRRTPDRPADSGHGSPFEPTPASGSAVAGPFRTFEPGPLTSSSTGPDFSDRSSGGPFGGRGQPTEDAPPGPWGRYPGDSR